MTISADKFDQNSKNLYPKHIIKRRFYPAKIAGEPDKLACGRFLMRSRIRNWLFGVNLLRVMRRVMRRSVGYICFVCTQCARTRAHMCAFAYFWTDTVQICWEHTMTHHKWQGLRTFLFHAPRARVCARARVIKCSLIYGRIFFKFVVTILQVTSSSIGYVLLISTHRARSCMCERARG
jgi:hypothetical protein